MNWELLWGAPRQRGVDLRLGVLQLDVAYGLVQQCWGSRVLGHGVLGRLGGRLAATGHGSGGVKVRPRG